LIYGFKTPRMKALVVEASKKMEEYANAIGASVVDVTSARRDAGTVSQRALIIKHLRSQGYTLNVIGAVLNRDHTSIMHLANDERRKRKNEQAKARG
jgi:hypothetical protein